MGPGLLESVYHQCLVAELEMRGVGLRTMEPVALSYKGMPLDKNFIIDILVENEVIVELKSVETILPVHEAHVISELQTANESVGLLINYHAALLDHGFKRVVNGLQPNALKLPSRRPSQSPSRLRSDPLRLTVTLLVLH